MELQDIYRANALATAKKHSGVKQGGARITGCDLVKSSPEFWIVRRQCIDIDLGPFFWWPIWIESLRLIAEVVQP